MTNPADLPPDVAARIADLEAKLARANRELVFYRGDYAELLRKFADDPPMTPEEEEELMNSPRGQPIEEIIAEFEAKLGSR